MILQQIVPTKRDFETNFDIFTESSLRHLDWNNVVAAGSSVVTSLLSVDQPHNESRRSQRTYYNEEQAPASDVYLFLYGLDEESAVKKLHLIEWKTRDSLLCETTTVRTKKAVTIVSQYLSFRSYSVYTRASQRFLRALMLIVLVLPTMAHRFGRRLEPSMLL